MSDKPFSIDFTDIENYLSTVFKNDAIAKSIIEKSGFTDTQLEIINIIVVAALKAYDLKKQQ